MTPIDTTDAIDTMDAKVDHFVCTGLHGRRVQVGPVTLEHARLIKQRIKEAASPSISYTTWVDWRRLEQYPLLDINAFYAEIMGEPRRPTLPLGQFSDSILIAEIKRRGYVVPKKDHVWDLTCQDVYPVHEYVAMARNSTWLHQAHRSLARRMGDLLLQRKVVDLYTVDGDAGETSLRMRVVVVAPEASHGHT